MTPADWKRIRIALREARYEDDATARRLDQMADELERIASDNAVIANLRASAAARREQANGFALTLAAVLEEGDSE